MQDILTQNPKLEFPYQSNFQSLMHENLPFGFLKVKERFIFLTKSNIFSENYISFGFKTKFWETAQQRISYAENYYN